MLPWFFPYSWREIESRGGHLPSFSSLSTSSSSSFKQSEADKKDARPEEPIPIWGKNGELEVRREGEGMEPEIELSREGKEEEEQEGETIARVRPREGPPLLLFPLLPPSGNGGRVGLEPQLKLYPFHSFLLFFPRAFSSSFSPSSYSPLLRFLHIPSLFFPLFLSLESLNSSFSLSFLSAFHIRSWRRRRRRPDTEKKEIEEEGHRNGFFALTLDFSFSG